MASPLEIAFADTIAMLLQCEESARRSGRRTTLAKMAECIAQSTSYLLAEIGDAGDEHRNYDAPALFNHALKVTFDTAYLARWRVEAARKLDTGSADPTPSAASTAGPRDGGTFLVVDGDGTFREADRGQTREMVVRDIATGECEVDQVLHLRGPICEDVTAAIADEVFDAVRHQRFGNSTFIPTFLADRFPDETEALRLSWMTPDEIRRERDDESADRAHEALVERRLEAAE